MSKASIFLTSIFIMLLTVSCLDDELKEVNIAKEETITSQIINDAYKLYFFIPPNYSESKKYPVVYLLDGDWHSERMANEINVMWNNNQIPECILVGIGNSEKRFRDYSYPEDDQYNESGGADEYYAFLKDELIPYIDSNYSTDITARVLAGHSLAGFFVFYALFQTENTIPLFSGYISASPSIFWKDGYLIGLEEELSNRLDDLQCSLFVGMGSDESLTMNILAEEMYERLLNRGYPELKQKYYNIKKTAHEGASIPTFTEGLIFTLNN